MSRAFTQPDIFESLFEATGILSVSLLSSGPVEIGGLQLNEEKMRMVSSNRNLAISAPAPKTDSTGKAPELHPREPLHYIFPQV
jgi:hypothetical protein